MRISLIILSTTLLLSACTLPWSSPATPAPDYPTTQSGSPAAQFCIKTGGSVSYEKNPNIPTMDMVYCTPAGGQTKIDAWQYMSTQTTQTGAAL